MKAMTLEPPGGLDHLRLVERERPRAGPGQVLVRVRANALNYHDYVTAKGMMPSAFGRVLMSDAAGEIEAVGEGVTAFQPGDRVFSVFYPTWLSGEGEPWTTAGLIPGENAEGYACEYAAVPWTWVTKAPDGYSHEEAAALTCAGLTAWRGVVSAGRAKPGDVVVTQGTGGVSIFALQFAKACGATVIATSSSPEKLAKLAALGADHVINYRETPDWGRAARDITGGRGVDLVVEVGGAGTFAQSIEACRMNGRISLIGVLAGIRGEVPLARAFTSQLTIRGLRVGSRADQEEMVRGLAASGVRPVIDSVYPLEALADAYRHQEAGRHFGKICVSI
jgi:NADPH:quinone reductase-like Zn-dependent oxidoreductase